MRLQASSLNGREWTEYREILIRAAREAQRATPTSDYATVLATVKPNQTPTTIHEKRCLTRWQSQAAKRLQMEVKQCGEATSVTRDSEVPRAATVQPLKPQPSRQEGEKTTDGGSATSEVPRAATVQPQTHTTTSARPGSPSPSHVVTHTQGVDETPTMCARSGSPSRSHAVVHMQGVDELPAAIQQVSNATADSANPYAACADPTGPARTTLGSGERRGREGDGRQNQSCGDVRRRHHHHHDTT